MTETLAKCACVKIVGTEIDEEMITLLAYRMVEIFGGADEAIAELTNH